MGQPLCPTTGSNDPWWMNSPSWHAMSHKWPCESGFHALRFLKQLVYPRQSGPKKTMHTNGAKWDPYTWPKIAFYLGYFTLTSGVISPYLSLVKNGLPMYLCTHGFFPDIPLVSRFCTSWGYFTGDFGGPRCCTTQPFCDAKPGALTKALHHREQSDPLAFQWIEDTYEARGTVPPTRPSVTRDLWNQFGVMKTFGGPKVTKKPSDFFLAIEDFQPHKFPGFPPMMLQGLLIFVGSRKITVFFLGGLGGFHLGKVGIFFTGISRHDFPSRGKGVFGGC